MEVARPGAASMAEVAMGVEAVMVEVVREVAALMVEVRRGRWRGCRWWIEAVMPRTAQPWPSQAISKSEISLALTAGRAGSARASSATLGPYC